MLGGGRGAWERGEGGPQSAHQNFLPRAVLMLVEDGMHLTRGTLSNWQHDSGREKLRQTYQVNLAVAFLPG